MKKLLVILVLVVTLTYILYAGLRYSTLTDNFQFFIVLIFLLICASYIFLINKFMTDIDPADHIANCFKKFATFEGSASRKEFWYFFLFFTGAQVVSLIAPEPRPFYFVDFKILDSDHIVTILVTAALFFPMLSVGARRLHDINKSGWWQLLMITGIGSIPLLIMWAREGNIK